MMKFVCFPKKPVDDYNHSFTKLSSFRRSLQGLFSSFFFFIVSNINPFWIQLSYFITVSFLGYLALKIPNPKASSSSIPSNIDMFFTSVSASTVSSMSTVEMEVFSNTQLVIMTILMLVGGEIFTSMLGLQFARFKYTKKAIGENNSSNCSNLCDQVEFGLVTVPQTQTDEQQTCSEKLKYESTKCLGYVVFFYLLVFHLVGSVAVSWYLNAVSTARKILEIKDLRILTFSVFTVVSSFSNCGFIPTNENMVVFKKNSGLLLLLFPLLLLGNTLFAPSLRFIIWIVEKMTRRVEFKYMLKNSPEMDYGHLLPYSQSCFLAMTVFGFLLVQVLLLCWMEWSSGELAGLNPYQKIVGMLFQAINSRHTGESIVDLSVISPAVLVLFVTMMYLPPQTSFSPIDDGEKNWEKEERKSKKNKYLEHILLSQLSYLVFFLILICIIEKEKLKEDPLNFNVLNITLEVVSAYGNVGFSTGYHCGLQLKPETNCKDLCYGFVGRWSSTAKFVLIIVMFFGRLKKFSLQCGKAWKLD